MAQSLSDRISFTGELKGESLINEFVNNDLYLFTSYHEGMPASVLEAMAFGLPVVSRPVGALVDFFKNDQMGYLVDSFNPQDFLDSICGIIESSDKCKMISNFNYEYAKQHFYASKITKQIEEILNKYNQ
jgi:glycosyltransferase involved in cell wall biosynthesis